MTLLFRRSLVNMLKHPMNVRYYALCIVIYIVFALIAFFRIGKDEDLAGF
jgi:hypothetical protein